MADTLNIPCDETGKERFAIDYDKLRADVSEDIDAPFEENTVALNNDNDSMRRMIEYCVPRAKTVLNPIIDWTEADVWGYIEDETLPYCSLYKYGGGVIKAG